MNKKNRLVEESEAFTARLALGIVLILGGVMVLVAGERA